MNILIMAGVTLLVCGLLISQAAHVALRAELRELSILRSLGVSRFGCFGAVVLEGAVLSFCGALLGCTVGYPLAVWLTGFLINTAQEIYQVTIKPFGVGYNFSQAISILAATAIWGAISAAAAARGVLSLAPYRGTRREQIHNHPLQRGPLIALAVLGTSLCVGTIVFAEHFGGAVLAYLSVASVLLCVVLCSPLAIFLIATWLPFTRTIVAMRLAAGSLQVAGRHFLLSGIAASLALALMTGLSLMVSSFHGTLSRWSATRLAGDLFVSAALSGSGNEARIDARYVDAIRASPAFRAVVPYYETNSEVAQQPVVVGGTDIVSQCARSVYTFIEGGCTDDKNSQDAGAFISESAARKLSLAIGSKFRLEEASFSVRGILQEFGTEQPLIVLDEGNFTQRYPAHQPKTITLDLADQNNHKQAREWLASLAPDVLVIRDSKELRDLVDTLFKRTFRVTESVRWIVFVLAILGLISAGAQYLWERRWEFKIATIIGVPAHTVTASVGVEVASVALAALAVGLSAGGLIGFCLTRYINPAVFGWSLDFSLSAKPFVEGGLFLLVSVVLCVLIARKMLAVIIQAVRVADE
jgi:ABC-type lipoprotein release transport system permease subunit